MVLIPTSFPSHSFGSRPRSKPQDSPGPGAYGGQASPSPVIRRTGQAVFGTSGRKCLEIERRGMPGPGSYSARECMAAQAPAYSLSPRRPSPRFQDQSRLPGPGDYGHVDILGKEGPQFSMAAWLRTGSASLGLQPESEKPENPGPGHFSGPVRGGPCSHITRKQAPSIGFGTSNREPGGNALTPGPGAYGHKRHLGESGSSYTMLERRSLVHDNSGAGCPGPGAHDHHPDFTGS